MHARHRNGPGNGYRSNALGMGGVAAASRISPDGSMRSHRVYNSDYRNNNRGGYGRGGHSKQFQQLPHPPRKTDIFVEAGKLAAEYLVSRGVLPPGALTGKWRNDGLKNHAGEFQGFRRFDEYNSVGLRSSVRERRTGSFKNYQPEANRELERSGSWAERSRASPSMEVDSDASARRNDEQPLDKDGSDGTQASPTAEATQEGNNLAHDVDHEELGLEKCNSMEDAGAKTSSSSNEKCLTTDADGETAKKSDDGSKFHAETDKEGSNHDELEQQQEENNVVTASAEDSLVKEENFDLLKHCKFDNVPTKARSSSTIKGSKQKQDPMNEDRNTSDRELSEVPAVDVKDVVNDNSTVNVSSCQNNESKSLESDVSHAPALEKELDNTHSTVPEQLSGSPPGRSVCKEQEPDQEMSGFGSSNTMLTERGGKRAMDDNADVRENYKKLREWLPQMDSQSDACLPLSTSLENQSTLQEEGTSRGSHATLSPDQKNLNISLYPRGHSESSEYIQEKQLFPGSFNTFDLNLNGTCDVNENHQADPLLIFPSVIQTGKEVAPIDVDLPMRNNCNLPDRYGKHGVDDNAIEVIDLESDSANEDKTFSNLERRGDAVFSDLEGFSNNVHNANEIPEVQDGYGFMISELLGNDNPNCSSIPTGLNSLPNDIGLSNGEGILGDDDAIYTPFGEIPMTYLGDWDQPPQDYGKPFR